MIEFIVSLAVLISLCEGKTTRPREQEPMVENSMDIATNKLAAASFIFGIFDLALVFSNYMVLYILVAGAALVCGSIALIQIKLKGGRGRGWAIGGIVLAFAFPIVLVILTAVNLVFFYRV